jgi:hypothetical protein
MSCPTYSLCKIRFELITKTFFFATYSSCTAEEIPQEIFYVRDGTGNGNLVKKSVKILRKIAKGKLRNLNDLYNFLHQK